MGGHPVRRLRQSLNRRRWVVVVIALGWGSPRAQAVPTGGVPALPKPATTAVPSTAANMSSTCVQDDAVPTPRGWQGWDRSAVIAWQAVEDAGGVVPEIEEDATHAPPGWWRYPSAVRSEALLDAEAKNPALGLYSAVAATELAKGDILVRARGAGVCGKMAVIGGEVDGQWVTIEVGPDGRGPSTRPASPLFFAADGHTALPQTRAFRIRVKKDDTLGHVRELRRDLDHLERTVGHHPPLLLPGEEAKQVVTEKVHDLIDEAWSLVADESFDLDRRELTGRALALGAYLDWPAARVAAETVLDDVLRRAPGRPAATAARAALTRSRDDLARATKDGAATPPDATIRYVATPEEIGVESTDLSFQVRWPLTWRLMGLSSTPETGVLANLVTGRVLLPDGHADRGTAVLLSQRPAGPAARVVLARDGARKMFPAAKMKALPAVVPGSRRTQFNERHDGTSRAGEVTTIDRGGVVTFLVLNAPGDVYPKLRDEYEAFVRSLRSLSPLAPTPGVAAPPAAVAPTKKSTPTGGAPGQ